MQLVENMPSLNPYQYLDNLCGFLSSPTKTNKDRERWELKTNDEGEKQYVYSTPYEIDYFNPSNS